MTMSDIFAILPSPTVESEPFWKGCNEGELRLQRCAAGHLFYHPRQSCPVCGSRDLSWERMSGRGKIYSFSHVNVSFQGSQWESQLPYTVILVDLEEGPRMVSRLVGPDRDQVRVSDSVALNFVEFEGQKLPFFRRA